MPMVQSSNDMLVLIDETIQSDPKNPLLWIKKGNLYLDKEIFDDAGMCYDQAVKFGPTVPEALEAKGSHLILVGSYEEALPWIGQLIEVTPNSLTGWNLKGIVYEKLNNLSVALTCYQEMINLKPQKSSGYINLALVYHRLEENSKAISYYKQYLSFDPDNKLVKEKLLELKEPLEIDYLKYRPIQYFSKDQFLDYFGVKPTEFLIRLLEPAYFDKNPSTFYTPILGCELLVWVFDKSGKPERTKGEPVEYYPIFSKIHHQSYGILKTSTKDIFAHFNGEEGNLDIIAQTIEEGVSLLITDYLKNTLSNLAHPEGFISTLLKDQSTQMVFSLLNKELSKDTLLQFST